MSIDDHFQQLSHCLAGVFQNREQALAEPAWFVHLRLWSQPIALFRDDSQTFFLEQASAAFKQEPYRQRILRIRRGTDGLTAEYYALKNPSAFRGLGHRRADLEAPTLDDLQPLTGSGLPISPQLESQAMRFVARHRPGERCQFVIAGETKWVELAFDAIVPTDSTYPAAFWMYDKGVDTATGKYTWGATNGPFKLLKVKDFSSVLNSAN